ncbi:MAG: putative filamentous hemagglutinin/adhesin [Phenylobacterium sp.]|nr:putative filamentous hemagglutinin/adhesin [Phenylobacterium sp.]
MRRAIAIAAAAASLATAGAAAGAGPSVEIKDAVVRVTVIPEDRADVKVEMLTTNAALPLDVRIIGSSTVIAGNLAHRIYDCHTRGDHPTAWVRGLGAVNYKDMPQVVIHTPKAVAIDAGGAVYGTVGRAASLALENSGCSAWTVADVAGDATVRESGAGSVRMGSSGRLDLRLSGAGSVHATQVRQGLDATLSGAGGVTVDDLTGAMQAHVSGVGHIKVAQGHVGALRASISGVGGVDFGGQAETLDASISGFGGIRVRAVSGQVTKSISGGGHVTVG